MTEKFHKKKRTIKRGMFAGYKVVAEDSDAINLQRQHVDKLLLMIGEYKGWDGDISHVFVSNLSTIGDFNLEDEELNGLSVQLGFNVAKTDYIHEVAMMMKPTN